jgi:hypothetical protein
MWAGGRQSGPHLHIGDSASCKATTLRVCRFLFWAALAVCSTRELFAQTVSFPPASGGATSCSNSGANRNNAMKAMPRGGGSA